MNDLKQRVAYLPTSIPALVVLVFLALCVWLKPDLIDRPESLFVIGAGLLGLLHKPRQ